MICTVLKGFALSRDGVTSEWAGKGERVDIPNEMVAGLVKEKFIGEASDLKAAAPENKALVGAEETQALTAALENKGAGEFSREVIESMTDNAAIVELLAVHGVSVDRRKSIDTLRSELLAVMSVGGTDGSDD